MLLSNLNLLATAPGGVARLRELILTLAVQGKLVPQDPADEPAGVLLQKIRAEKDRLIAEGKIKRDKPLGEIAEEEKPFELPQDWEWVRLGQIAMQVTDGTHHTPKYLPTGVAFISVKDIDGNTVSFNDCKFISEEEHRQINARCNPEKGDLLLCRIGTLGRPTLVDTDRPFSLFVSVGLIKLPKSCDLSAYFHLVMKGPLLAAQYQEIKAGGSHTNKLNLGDIPQLRIPVPPLAEQSRIVTRVEELMRLCDALEAKGQLEATQHAELVSTLLGTLTASTTPEELAENWQRVAQHFDLLLDRPEAIDALEQTLLQLAARGLLVPQDPTDEPASALLQKIRAEKDRLIATGQIKRDKPLPPITDEEKPFELPVGWEWVRLGALIELVSGQHLGPSEYVDGLTASLPYLTGPAEFGVLSPEPTRSTDERRAVAIYDDILITVKGSGVGKLNVVNQDEMAISRQLMAIRPVLLNAEFLMVFLQTLYLYFQEKSIGIAIPGIGREDVTHAEFGLPPLAEQYRIVTRVTALRRLCADLRQRLAGAQTTQSHLAQALVDSTSFV
jgi:type I restriction enzyme S subunit